MARRVDQRLSFCLAHQDRPTDTRCAACLKPICEECTLVTDQGKFCGNECFEKRMAANERVQILKAEEERDRIPKMIRTLIGWGLKILFLVALYFVYTQLPDAWKGWLDKSFAGLWKTISGAFGR